MSQPQPPENFTIEAPTTPHNAEAEESIIGMVLADADWLDFITLSVDDFYIHRFRFIWAAIQAVRSAGLGIDYITVTNELERRGQLLEIGGGASLYDIMNRAPMTDNADSYAEIVRQAAINRRYLDLSATIAKQALNGGVDVAAAIDVLTMHSQGNRDGRHISEALDDLSETVRERMENPKETWGITTGFVDWDKRMGGLHLQQVLLLAGDSGTGKTTLMLQGALAAAKAGHGVAIFEKEMDEQRTLRRLVELECGVTNRAMMSGSIGEVDISKFTYAVDKLTRLPIFINDDPATTTADLRSIVARARTKMNIEAIYLDYLGLLDDKAPGNREDWDQTKAVRFRSLCREMNLAGFAIQDMTKSASDKIVPDLSDMSGGAKVRFGADWVFFLVKDSDNDKLHYLVPAKQRDGDRGSKSIPLTRPGLGFVNANTREINLRDVV